MTGIAQQIPAPASGRQLRAALRRAVAATAASTAAIAAAVIRRLDTLGDGGQLGPEHEAAVGRWAGARV